MQRFQSFRYLLLLFNKYLLSPGSSFSFTRPHQSFYYLFTPKNFIPLQAALLLPPCCPFLAVSSLPRLFRHLMLPFPHLLTQHARPLLSFPLRLPSSLQYRFSLPVPPRPVVATVLVSLLPSHPLTNDSLLQAFHTFALSSTNPCCFLLPRPPKLPHPSPSSSFSFFSPPSSII